MAPHLFRLGKKLKTILRPRNEDQRSNEGSRSVNIASTSRPSARAGQNNINHHPDFISFTLRELERATNNFSRDSIIGKGSFGNVYLGFPQSTQQIAVKQLKPNSEQGHREFMVEVSTLSFLQHPNIIHLFGYCSEGNQRFIVYEYMPLGSLKSHLHDHEKAPLDWNKRMKIAAGTAKALQFLHIESEPRVVFRDVKTSNVLLGGEFNPKLSDFGIAKIELNDGNLGGRTISCTPGYCAPEYASEGRLTTMVDVYAFGVIMLELATGRNAVDDKGELLVDWVRINLRDHGYGYIPDDRLKGEYPDDKFEEFVDMALRCAAWRSENRPIMSEVVDFIDRLVMVPEDVPVPDQKLEPPLTWVREGSRFHRRQGSI